jgi:hypothetical protein
LLCDGVVVGRISWSISSALSSPCSSSAMATVAIRSISLKEPEELMLKTSPHGSMCTIFAAGIVLILEHSAYSIERMECGGTEPFWDAKLSDTQVIFALSGGGRTTIYPAPRYRAAKGAGQP